jgi:hypothetical protein
MFNEIKNDETLKNIFYEQLQTWWGNEIDFSKVIILYEKYLKDKIEVKNIIERVKEMFCKNIRENQKLSELIDSYLIPQELEKKQNAEISTPYKLRQEMLDTIDKYVPEFWKEKRKIFEPCCGKGGFLIDVVNRFLKNGLKYKIIVEDCLYFSDINPTNIFICKLLLDPYNEYKLNYNAGNTLKLDVKKKWKLDGFDLVIGNPPYQNSTKNKGRGNILWDLFVEKSINEWLFKDGYLLFIHPRGWRQINNKTGNLMKKQQIIYLNMNNIKKGQIIFKCSTDYDYYLLQHTNAYKKTIINDYKNNIYEYTLNNMLFIPNHSFKEVMKLIDKNNPCNFINDQSIYEPRKKWMFKNKTDVFKYPCIYSINLKNKPSLKWSSVNDKGHFGISKFIFSNGLGYLYDSNGKYGLTQWAYAIPCNEKDKNLIRKIFVSDKFKNIINAIQLTSNKYNYNILKYFKKDFWNDFCKK